MDADYIIMRQKARKAAAKAAELELVSHSAKKIEKFDQFKFTFGKHFGMSGEKSLDSIVFKAVSAEEFEADVWAGALVEPPFDPSGDARVMFVVENRDPGCNIMVGVVGAAEARKALPTDGGAKGRGADGRALCNIPHQAKRLGACMYYASTGAVFTDGARKIGALEPVHQPRINETIMVRVKGGVPMFYLDDRLLEGRIDMSGFPEGKLPSVVQFAVDLGPIAIRRQVGVGGGKTAERVFPTECAVSVSATKARLTRPIRF